MSQSDRCDDGHYQYDDWKTDCQTKPVKHIIQSAENGLIPKVVPVNIQLPGKSLRAHLVETRHLIHGSHSELRKHKNRHADNNYECDSLCGDASLSSQGKQDTDTSFSWDGHRQERGAVGNPIQSDDVVVDHVPSGWTKSLSVCEWNDLFCAKSKNQRQRQEVDQGEREETEVDSLLEALLEEHGHVDAVGGEADEEEDGDDDGVLDSVKKDLRLITDEVVGVVPRDGRVYSQDDAVFWDTVRWLADVVHCPWWRHLSFWHSGFWQHDH